MLVGNFGEVAARRLFTMEPQRSSADVLVRWPLLRSPDPADMVYSLNSLYQPSEVRSIQVPAGEGMYELRGFVDQGFAIGYIKSNIAVQVGNSVSASYFVNFGLSGSLHSALGDERVQNTSSRAVIYNPGDRQTLAPQTEFTETLGIRLSRELVEQELAALLGRELDRGVRFDFSLDLTNRMSGGLRMMLDQTLQLYDAEHDLIARPEMRLSQMRAFITGLLLTHRHTLSETLHSGANPMRPRTLGRAMDYLEEHFHDPLTLGDIASAANCSVRTLTSAFQRHLGISPMVHLRNLRLEHTRALLIDTGTSVSDAAIQSGFTHLGRFAKAYSDRFGERPSETRGRI
jgi:AraC-like DNA-binding protein